MAWVTEHLQGWLLDPSEGDPCEGVAASLESYLDRSPWRDDFDLIPTLSREGGWGAANKAFGGRLGTLLAELNEALAA